MRNIFIYLTVTIFSFAALAQSETPSKNVWVQLSLGIENNNGFGDAAEDVQKSSQTKGLTFGWEPFKNSTGDGVVANILRHIGFTAGATSATVPSYDVVLEENYQVLSPFEVRTTCGGSLGFGEKCFDCGYDNFGLARTCTGSAVYGRITDVKYTKNTVAVGMYVPVEAAKKLIKKLTVEVGVDARLHVNKEGLASNALHTSYESTYAGTLRVVYPYQQNLSISGGITKSFAGSKSGAQRFKYSSYYIGGTIHW